ncbi:MAG: hypothetical protein OJF51_000013 [Nitrospira sp.]|jgi:hypothetical protein|nr:MAG: hypothetical protein OJF51_000013 [Nitrospira sp.]
MPISPHAYEMTDVWEEACPSEDIAAWIMPPFMTRTTLPV